MEFSCTARQGERHVVLTVSGDVDLAAHARFQAEAEPWAAAPHDLILDCSGVTFLDSMGLRVLVQLRRLVTDDGREFALRAPSESVRRVLELAGVESLFPVVAADSGVEPGAEPDPEPDPDPVS
ncbi:MAG: STAS domain-containing protein [Catenulispora sp.]|nr:STAS domain-containing protein [Catenulispora sp.]